MKEELTRSIYKAAQMCGVANPDVRVDYPEDFLHGDLTTNVAMVYAKQVSMPPKVLAEKIISELKKSTPDFLKDAIVAGPGFVNFFLKEDSIATQSLSSGATRPAKTGRRFITEFTDPNTFKVFHIGHMMSNAIGESISRMIEYKGDTVTRICYPSDIGLHIAKAVWAIKKHETEMPVDDSDIRVKTDFLGRMYVEGTNAYETDQDAKKEIDVLNGVIYKKDDADIDRLYKKGKKWSLDHFEILYRVLGTNFDDVLFESDMAPIGLAIVRENVGKVFEESDGAIVFKGEKFGSHTRVFVSSNGLPTYEAKEIGLNVTKFEKYPDTEQSIIITANEQNDYFKCVLKALAMIDPHNGPKTKHIGHGMMRFASGKMSSRTGKVVTAEALLSDMRDLVSEKISDRNFSESEADTISNIIAIGAIKYTILRQAIGGDIVFNSASSISFEGDSGPYLQYSTVRARSVLEKAKGLRGPLVLPEKVGALERLLVRFEDVVSHARADLAPQVIANYLISLATAFNHLYASQTIIGRDDGLSPYYIALTQSFNKVMTDGLWLLGIEVPDRM